MASDYKSIKDQNLTRYGTDVARYGRKLLADSYDDRTHFIYEILQNAEDALRKRINRSGSRCVRFELSEDQLLIYHTGKPFDPDDVRGICGIGESTKDRDYTTIGRFGIGFKSVYAVTERPEIHSGEEDFAIENYVHPVAIQEIPRSTDVTIIKLPLKERGYHEEIRDGMKRLGPDSLLFLHEIEEIEWKIENGASGLYLRGQSDQLAEHVQQITIIGKEDGQDDIEQDWLVFSKLMTSPDGEEIGNVEIAFSVKEGRVVPVTRSFLVVFFPTVVETHLGFRVQGPYRTTPSRDNVPKLDGWNRKCVEATADLLEDALIWLRDRRQLDIGFLQCLPLDRNKFDKDSMFAPLYDQVRTTLAREQLLPCFGGGYATANDVKLARTQDLRELFDPIQLAQIFGITQKIKWLIHGISQDRTPQLRQYLMSELSIDEITPERILPKIDTHFLKMQTNDWIRRLYEFLHDRHHLLKRVEDLPLIRLTNGQHVPVFQDDQPQAFLPGKTKTDFPTVHPEVCNSDGSIAFLSSLSLTVPDPINDIIRNILPKYRKEGVSVGDTDFYNDIQRILEAYSTDSNEKRNRLIEALREAFFVTAVDSGNGEIYFSKPDKVYLATERLTKIFAGISNVLIVDNQRPTLQGKSIRQLLEACGVARHLRIISDTSLSSEEKEDLRKKSTCETTSGINDSVIDWSLCGLDKVLDSFMDLTNDEKQLKAQLIWEELINLKSDQGESYFTGKYTWTYYGSHTAPPFDSAFIRALNEKKWIPNSEGELKAPNQVLFESLEWRNDPFLLSKIRFKQPVVDQLEKEAGFEPGVLDLLKDRGLTSVKALVDLLGSIEIDHSGENINTPSSVSDATKAILGGGPQPTPPSFHPQETDPVSFQHNDVQRKNAGYSGDVNHRQFISYVAVHQNNEETVLGESEYQERKKIEEQAIKFILNQEPDWQRTKASNPGFDLYKSGENGEHIYWCEVKAMTGSLDNRSVGLSYTQFEYARDKGGNYWLYIVEHTGTDQAQIIRIQNPAGRTRTFTFDHGWRSIAAADME